jgi:hypothetical protein
VLVAECNRLVTPADIAAAWREIQRLPPPSGLEPRPEPPRTSPATDTAGPLPFEHSDDGMEMIEFGAGDDGVATLDVEPKAAAPHDPWSGPDVEMASGHADDPFAALFRDDPAGDAAWCGEGPDDFRERPSVKSRDGQALSRLLASLESPHAGSAPSATPAAAASSPAGASPCPRECDDDADMVLVVDDADDQEPVAGRVAAVRPDDYRSLFTRLRHGSRR